MGRRAISYGAAGVVLFGVAFAVGVRHGRSRRPALEDPVELPLTVPVLRIGGSSTLFPGSIYPVDINRPDSKARLMLSQIVAVTSQAPAPGRIVCAARVMETKLDGATVHAVLQGVARVRPMAPMPWGEWSVVLADSSDAGKQQARAAAEEVRALALRALAGRDPFPGAIAYIKSVTDPSQLIDLVASAAGLPAETQAAVLQAEDLSARAAIVKRSLEARIAAGTRTTGQ